MDSQNMTDIFRLGSLADVDTSLQRCLLTA